MFSKTNDGSFKKLPVKGKKVPIYACPDIGERCPVHIRDKYLSKLSHRVRLILCSSFDKVSTDPRSCWSTSGKWHNIKQTEKHVQSSWYQRQHCLKLVNNTETTSKSALEVRIFKKFHMKKFPQYFNLNLQMRYVEPSLVADTYKH